MSREPIAYCSASPDADHTVCPSSIECHHFTVDMIPADEAPTTVEPLAVSNVKPSYFRKVYGAAREDSSMIREATSDYDTTPAARGTMYYHWSDGSAHAGFAVRADGELVYVFSTARGMGDRLVSAAIVKGATHLDCFDGHLTSLYSRHGFARVTSLPNWTAGGPDVVFMARPGHFLMALDKAES